MSSTYPNVSICIPHWQVKQYITLCLRSIRKFCCNFILSAYRGIPTEGFLSKSGYTGSPPFTDAQSRSREGNQRGAGVFVP